jgi:hypothetical protein
MINMSFQSSSGLAAILVLMASALPAEEISFNRDIKPILSENCFTCHGPDEAQRSGGFRLDLRESAIAAADSGEPPISANVLLILDEFVTKEQMAFFFASASYL